MDWSNCTVLLTGGTGSFGQKFTEFFMKEKCPKELIVFSRDELKQTEMAERFEDLPVTFMLGDVRDRNRVFRVMDGVDVVVHAAALKQVLTRKFDASEALQTNIIGSQNILDAALERGIGKCLLISTDKAAYPISLYGASKLCAEKLFISANAFSKGKKTRFACARYGNVLGSRGSVAPLFLRQRTLGTLTVTDPNMTRFMMTIDEGVKFVMRCLELMEGREIFVPKVPSMRILDLAAAIAPEVEIKIIGRRMGEKIHELLLTEDEISRTRLVDGEIFVIAPNEEGLDRKIWEIGEVLPSNYTFSSDSNDRWLSVKELRCLVHGNED